MNRHQILSILFLLMVLVACGDKKETTKKSSFDPKSPEGKGEALFQTNCATCHAVKGGRVIVGPSLEGVASRAETRVENMTAREYLHNSIVTPNSYVVEGFVEGSMPQNFGRDLTTEQVDSLVAYLLTLK